MIPRRRCILRVAFNPVAAAVLAYFTHGVVFGDGLVASFFEGAVPVEFVVLVACYGDSVEVEVYEVG